MFNNLSEKLSAVFKKLANIGVIRENHLQEALREVRLALLEADVHVSVVRELIERVKKQVLGQKLLGSQTAAQKFYKIIYDELVQTLGGEVKTLELKGRTPHGILLAGLQGCGKTTTAAKLALYFQKKGRHPLLVPADLNRPAAIEQLKTLGQQINIPVFDTNKNKDALANIQAALIEAKKVACDLIIVDTAGRLHLDRTLMDELKRIKEHVDNPCVLFVADAMTGQVAVNVAKAFHDAINIDGMILTKLDGDARGGAALSIQSVAQCPIYFVGLGEKIDALELFYPDRLVSRILDRGDIMSLVEKAVEVVDEEEAVNVAKKFVKNEFDLEDFRTQLRQMKKLGSMSSLLGFLPGAKQMMKHVNMDDAEKEMKKKEAIINSMTSQERRKPGVLNGSRRNRIALGSGTSVAEINRFMKEFETMKEMMSQIQRGGMGGIMEMLRGMRNA